MKPALADAPPAASGAVEVLAAANEKVVEVAGFEEHFAAFGVSGSILFFDLQGERWLGYGGERNEQMFLPASTFKLFNSLVALETRVIGGADAVLHWDGVKRKYAAWNQDLTLKQAIQYSAVWYYQELARRIGSERMQGFLDHVRYGNRKIGGAVDRFWLDGGIRISPRQQVDFLRRLHADDLPFSRRTMDLVKEIMVVEKREDYTLRAKTGWGASVTPQVGWYVGWLEREGRAVFFATCIEVKTRADLRSREGVTRRCLQELGALEAF